MLTRRRTLAISTAAVLATRRFARADTAPLKITSFSVHKFTLRWRDLVLLEIKTDGGITGLGEATLENRADTVAEGLRWLEQHMAGMDPAAPEDHWDRSYYRLSRWRNGPVAMSALSAVDMALWDIEGKRLGVPVWRLLGGPIHSKLRVYWTHWHSALKNRSPEALADHARATRERGWTAVKWTIPLTGSESERTVQTVAELEAVRKAVGNSMDLCLEAAESFSTRSAIEFARAVAPYRPLFLEEPTWRENPSALAEIAAKSPVSIATGEGLFSRFEFKQLLDVRGAAIVQPDVMHAGGITEIRKIASLAETYGVEIAPHQCSGPVAHVASIHAMSVCRNFLVEEWEAEDDAIYREVTNGTYPVQKGGTVMLPERPGLGIEVDFEAFTKLCPFRPINKRILR